MSDISDTQPNPVANPPEQKKKKFPWWASLIILVLLLALGAFGGYRTGMSDRLAVQATNDIQQLNEQFQLGVQAMDEGRYEVALTHFRYVIDHDRNYPGALDKYTQILILIGITPTVPVVSTLTPTLSPTPDLRGVEELFSSAKALINAQDWDGAITTLDTLRKEDATYRAVEVDGMYFMALRNRGMGKIIVKNLNDTCQQISTYINLEGGIYDLTLAERFGLLDGEAAGLRDIARLYITGASFWEIDWEQAQYFFGQVYMVRTNMMDASCQTAAERYRYASIKYGDELAAAGDYCGAVEQYNIAFSISDPRGANAEAYPTATAVYIQCYGEPQHRPTKTPTPGGATEPPVVTDTTSP